MIANAVVRDYDQVGWARGLHQHHINLRLRASCRFCLLIRVDADVCEGQDHAKTKACLVSDWFR